MTQEEKIAIVKDYLENNLTIKELRSKYHRGYTIITKILEESGIAHGKGERQRQKLIKKSEDIIADYKNGILLADLISKYHTTYKALAKILNESNIPHGRNDGLNKRRGVGTNPKNQRVLTYEEEKKVCDVYLNTKNISECEKVIQAGQDVIRRCLQKYNLYRTQEEAIKDTVKINRKYWVNDTFFDEETPDVAYIIGFLAADGCVSKKDNTVSLGLSSVDREILEKFRSLIGGRPIDDYITSDGYNVSKWTVASKKIKDKLAEYNIVPQKTFTFTFPSKLKRENYIHFIRGYFDGDGSVSTAGPSAIRWQICATNQNVLVEIVNYLYKEYQIPKTSVLCSEKNRKSPIYYIQYSTVPTRLIYSILYPENCIYLQRKKKKFDEIVYRNLKK